MMSIKKWQYKNRPNDYLLLEKFKTADKNILDKVHIKS